MGILAESRGVSTEEYLHVEKTNEVRHEYVGGNIYSMSGASEAHNLINGNIYLLLRTSLRGKSCKVFASDMKVHLSALGDEYFYYPDAMVCCDSSDTQKYYKEKPKFIAEVVSPSTERIDKREKLFIFQQMESLEEYVIVEQSKKQVMICRREDNWTPVTYSDNQPIEFRSLDITTTLDEIYEDIL